MDRSCSISIPPLLSLSLNLSLADPCEHGGTLQVRQRGVVENGGVVEADCKDDEHGVEANG